MAYDRRKEEYEVARPGRTRLDYRQEMGRAHVPIGVERDFVVLDPGRAARLRAWVSTLIPASGERPAAADVGAAEYVDATVFQAPRLRGVLLDAIDALDRLAFEAANQGFIDLAPPERSEVLRVFERDDALDVFALVRDLTYEAYYAHPFVLEILERETGWRADVAISGAELEPFDEELLARMRAAAPRFRKA